MNIGRKLTLSNGFMAVVVVVVAVALARFTVSVDKDFDALTEHRLKVTLLLENLRFAGLWIVSSTNEYLLVSVLGHKHQAEEKSESGEQPGGLEIKLIESSINSLNNATILYGKFVEIYFPDEVEFLRSIENLNEKLIKESRGLIRLADDDIVPDELLEQMERLEVVEEEFLKIIDVVLAHEIEEFEESKEEIEKPSTPSSMASGSD